MASDLIVGMKTLPASGDLSASQFCFMKVDTNGRLALPSAGGLAIGVLQDKPKVLGQGGGVCRPGDITRVVTGAGVTAGALVETDASGHAIPAVSGGQILGQTLEAANSAEVVRVVFQPMGKL